MNKIAQQIEDMAAKGMARKQIADALGVSNQDVDATMRVLNIKPNRPTFEEKRVVAAAARMAARLVASAERKAARLAAIDARRAATNKSPLAHNPRGAPCFFHDAGERDRGKAL